jgi:SAM-dependent methyltransferase
VYQTATALLSTPNSYYFILNRFFIYYYAKTGASIFMPFNLYLPVTNNDSLGQSWAGDEWLANINLCNEQSIRHTFFKYLPKQGLILEAGCGLGRWVFFLRDHGYTVQGIEISEQALTIIRPHDPEGYVQKGDIRAISVADHSVEAVISLGVMEHFKEGPQELLKETDRILASHGILLISIPPTNIIRQFMVHPLHTLKFALKKMRGETYAFAEYRYTEKEFKTHLSKSGFVIIDTVTDELELPKNIGLYVDFPKIRSKKNTWELSPLGQKICRLFNTISPKLHRGGVLFVCRKKITSAIDVK